MIMIDAAEKLIGGKIAINKFLGDSFLSVCQNGWHNARV